MRYNQFIDSIERVKAKYEAEIRKLLTDMATEDQVVEQAILHKDSANHPPRTASSMGLIVRPIRSASWTPARRAKQSRLMKRRMRAKYGKAKS